ncbi:MAG: zinc ribbon domain-containing protein, partial [Eggerthellaceae bacterium]|nr:zinc ribbon domain-containing protein [Eggerthellaceae bacterium]
MTRTGWRAANTEISVFLYEWRAARRCPRTSGPDAVYCTRHIAFREGVPMKHCTKCGGEIEDTAKFCTWCGA